MSFVLFFSKMGPGLLVLDVDVDVKVGKEKGLC